MSLLPNDCFLHDRDRLRHHEALAIIRERVSCAVECETVPVSAATGRVLAVDVRAPRPIPAHRNAAVDGYAFRAADQQDVGIPVTQRIAAGAVGDPLASGSAARIFTGAPMPPGADTVAMQEDVSVVRDGIRLPQIKVGANVRGEGEDFLVGTLLASAGARLRPQDVAAVAAAGAASVIVRRCLRVGVLANGAEILTPGEPFRDAAVYDSNTPMLTGLLRGFGHEPVPLGIAPDEAFAVRERMTKAITEVDALITVGGASKGEEDHVLSALDELGSRHLWQLAVKPGRPLIMGEISGKPVVGLPGNPVAAFVCMLLYVRPLLECLSGAHPREPVRYLVPSGFALRSKPDRREFLRGWIEGTASGARVVKFPRDGSGLISGLTSSTGLIEIVEEAETVEVGEPIPFIPYTELGVSS